MTDLRQAIRSLVQQPAFAVLALLTISLAIGANTAVFAVVHAVLIDPLPFPHANDLVQIWETHPDLHNLQVSAPDFSDWRKTVKSMDLAAYTFQAMNKMTLTGRGLPQAVQGVNASPELLSVLGVKPLLGRVYNRQDRTAPLVLISEQLWRSKFSADSGVIGQSLRLGASSFTIVGVVDRRLAFPEWADIWMPLSRLDPELRATRKYHPLEVIGRLKPGFSLQQAEVEIETSARRSSAAYPDTNGKVGAFATPLAEAVTGEIRPAVLAAWIAVGLIFLIACVNLAHLTLARALNRRREIALRLALGASRLAVVRTFFIETLLLSFAGGVLGLLAATFALPLLKRLAAEQAPRPESVVINLPVAWFGLCTSLVVAFLFAAPSFLAVFRSDLNEAISSGSTRSSSARRSWLSPVLMSSEIALSLAVSIAAVLLVRNFALTIETKPGFEPHGVLAVHSPLIEGNWQKSHEFFRTRLMPQLKSIPGVLAVAAVNSVPMGLGRGEHSRYATRFGIAGVSFNPGQFPTAQIRWCTPDYLRVLGVPVVRGRQLEETDSDQPREMVNEAFARRFFLHTNPVGQKLLMDVVSPHPQSVEIVGVVGDVREFSLTAAPEPTIYSIDVSPDMDVVLKTAGPAATIGSAIAASMRRANPQEAIGPVKTLDSYIARSLARQRFILWLIAIFAAVAICQCAVGIYGVFSYSVARRSREFGIRSAIGATRQKLAAQVVRECCFVIVPGLLAGFAISAAGSRLLASLLYRVSPADALSSLAATVCILGCCLASVLVPAWRAAQADPARAFREQ